MGISVEREGATVVAAVAGPLTAGNRQELRRHVLGALERGARHVVIDLGAAGYVDSAALGTLVMLAKRVRARGGELRLANLNEDVRSLLVLTELDTVLSLDTQPRAPAP